MQQTPEQRNYAEIQRLEQLLESLRRETSIARETEAIREIGLEIAMAVREVGAMLIDAAQASGPTRTNGSNPS